MRHRQAHVRRVAHAAVALAVGGVGVLAAAVPASAAAPQKYGWWSATNTGVPAVPAPPDVPAKGLYVEQGFSGPAAVSALTLQVPAGSQVGDMTLTTAGSPIITSPPQLCQIKAGSLGYRPAQYGQLSQAPAYDCKAGHVTGAVSSDQKTVTFKVAPLVRNGTIAVVVLAGAAGNRIPFQPPNAATLAVVPASSPSAAPSGGPGSGGSGAPASGAPASGTTAGGAGGASSAPAPADAGGAPAAAMPDLPATSQLSTSTSTSTGAAPQVAAPTTAAAPAGGQPVNAAATGPGGSGSGGSGSRIATVLGVAAMVIALVLWVEGFGVLGGRAATFTTRARRTS